MLLSILLLPWRAQGREAIYVWPCHFAEDHFNRDLAAESWLLLTDVAVAHGFPRQVFFGALAVGRLAAGLGEAWRAELASDPLLSFGYHGEEAHGPHPVLVGSFGREQVCADLLAGLEWLPGVWAAERRYTHMLDPLSGELIEWAVGGAPFVALLTGRRLQAVTAHGLQAANGAFAFAQMDALAEDGVFLELLPQTILRAGRGDLLKLRDELFPEELFWFMGRLTVAPDEAHAGLAQLDQLDRSRPHLVVWPTWDWSFYAQRDPWRWAYASPEWGCFPPSEAAARLPADQTLAPEERRELVAGYDRALSMLGAERFAEDPQLAVVLAEDIPQLVEPAAVGALSFVALAKLAERVAALEGWRREDGQWYPPMWLSVEPHGRRPISLAEVFSLFRTALAAYAEQGHLPAVILPRAPLGPINLAPPAEGGGIADVALESVLRAARELGELDAVPPYIWVAGAPLNCGEFLLLMGRAVQELLSGRPSPTLTIPPVAGVPWEALRLMQGVAPSQPEPLWHTACQLWTCKRVVWKPLGERAGAPPEILGTGIITRGLGLPYGHILALAWVRSPSGSRITSVTVASDAPEWRAELRDDGLGADQKAGDGLFTFRGPGPPAPPGARLRCRFSARDAHGLEAEATPDLQVAKHRVWRWRPPEK
jgi:hypothetical protein